MRLNEPFTLASHCLVEPLVNSWSAWSYLIAPLPASLYTANYLIPMMESYLQNPELHYKAAGDLELYGGAFIGLMPERVSEIEGLLERTRCLQGKNLSLAQTVHEFHKLLLKEAKGQSLEPYYKYIPDELRGCVELVYDYYNRPAVRFLEGVLYKSDYYNEALQSFQLSKLTHDGARPSFFHMPRLGQEEKLDWSVPFRSPVVDELFRCDLNPRPLAEIMEMLNLTETDLPVLLPLLSQETVPRFEKYEGDAVKLRYLGHACVLIEWKGITILTDPFVGVKPAEHGVPRLSYRDLPEKIDYVLVTHNHQDHFLLETLLRLRNRIQTLVVPRSFGLLYGDTSLRLMARTLGFTQVIDVEEFDSIPIPEGQITAIPFLGEHADFLQGKTAYVVRCGTRQMLFAADSDFLDPQIYRNVFKTLGPVDAVFLGTESVGGPLSWTCGPLFPERPEASIEQGRRYHGCGAASALELLETIGATRIYNYAMALEPWIHHLIGGNLSDESPQLLESEQLLAKARRRGFEAAERLFSTRTIYLEQGRAKTVAQGISEGASARWRELSGGTAANLTAPTSEEEQIRSPLDNNSLEVSQNIERHSFVLSPDLVMSLRSTARDLDSEMFLLILTGFEALLYQCTEEEEIVMETMGVRRSDKGIGHSQEPAARLVSFRADLSGNPTFQHLLRRVERLFFMACSGTLDDSSIEAGAPAIRAAFFHVPADERMSQDKSLEIRLSDQTRVSEEWGLQLLVLEGETSVRLTFRYLTSVINSDMASALSDHFLSILEQIHTNPEERLSDFTSAPTASPQAGDDREGEVAEQFHF